MSPRAAHTAVYLDDTDSLYVFGGYDLNNVMSSLQIYRFAKNVWEDEWGVKLRTRYFSKNVDSELLRGVLRQADNTAEQFGIRNEASLFRSILLSISDGNLMVGQRHQRSATPPIVETLNGDDLNKILETVKVQLRRPSARYGHAASVVPGGFVIYGGKLENGSLANDLWLYNLTGGVGGEGGQWQLRGFNSTVKPLPLTRHTLTLANDYLYLFGGSTEDGEFSSR